MGSARLGAIVATKCVVIVGKADYAHMYLDL